MAAKEEEKAARKNKKRPPNNYFIFSAPEREIIKRENTNLTFSEISKEIAKRWNALSKEEQENRVSEIKSQM